MAVKMTAAQLLIELKAENAELKKQLLESQNTKTDTSSNRTGELLLQYKKDYESLEKEYEQKIKELSDEMNQIKRKNVLLGDKSDKTREVLKLSAFGYAAGNIHTILVREKGLDISLQDVIRIVDNIENMPPDEYEFYKKCKKDFTDKVSIDSGFFTTTIYKKYMLLESTLSEQLSKAKELEDTGTINKTVESLMKLYDNMAKTFAKNGIDIKRESELDKLQNDIVGGRKEMQTAEPTNKSIPFGKLKAKSS